MKKLLVLILLVFFVSCDDTRSLDTVPTPTPSSTVTNSEKPKANSKIIEGEFSAKKAFELLYGNYSEEQKESNWKPSKEELAKFYESSDSSSEKDFYVTSVLVSPFKEAGTDKYMVVTSASPPDNDCHACAPVLGVAVFKKDGNKWSLELEQKYVDKIGSYGTAPDGKLVKIGDDSYGILLESSDTGQGYTYQGVALLANINRTFKNVLFAQTAGDNSGTCGDDLGPCWQFSSKYEFIPGKNKNFYDFKVEFTGTKGQEDDPKKVIPANETKIYEFNGTDYKSK
jgi:hypothetical protein